MLTHANIPVNQVPAFVCQCINLYNFDFITFDDDIYTMYFNEITPEMQDDGCECTLYNSVAVSARTGRITNDYYNE